MSTFTAAAVFGLASLAMAQSSCGTPRSTTTINAAADIPTACSTYSGSVAIATGATGDFDFGGLQSISGDLTASNSSVTSLSGAQLRSISGGFMLEQARSVTNINFPQLTTIGTLNWATVPNLGSATLGSGNLQINDFTIDDSSIQDLSSISLVSARTVKLSNNARLTGLNWPTRNISDSLYILQNGQTNTGFSAQFPNLASVGMVQVRRVSSLGMPSLTNASALDIQSSSFQNLTFPNLTMVTTGIFQVANNSRLNDLEVPMLSQIGGGLVVQGNPQITGNLSFPALLSCANMQLGGSFSSLGLPKINTVRGLISVATTNTDFNCQQVLGYNPGVTQATPSCASGRQAAATGAATNVAGGATSTGSQGAASANSVNLGPASLFGATGLLAVMFGLV